MLTKPGQWFWLVGCDEDVGAAASPASVAAGSIGVCLCFESGILAGFYLTSISLLQLLLMLVELWNELNY